MMDHDRDFAAWHEGEERAHSYFVPMVDMLAGVVFILVIMLAATALLSRQDFSEIEPMQREINAVRSELAQVRELERSLLTPRLEARRKLSDLLGRFQKRLSAEGLASSTLPAQGQLQLTDPDLFTEGSTGVTEKGRRAASVLAQTIATESACADPSPPVSSSCLVGGLDLASIRVVASGAELSPELKTARSLTYLNLMAEGVPELLGLQAMGGYRLMEFETPGAADTSPITLKFDLAPMELSRP